MPVIRPPGLPRPIANLPPLGDFPTKPQLVVTDVESVTTEEIVLDPEVQDAFEKLTVDVQNAKNLIAKQQAIADCAAAVEAYYSPDLMNELRELARRVCPNLSAELIDKTINGGFNRAAEARAHRAQHPTTQPKPPNNGIGQNKRGHLVEPPTSPGPHKTRFKLTSFDDLKWSQTSEYLVKGWFPRKGLAIVWGPPKCGKSFWVFTVVMHIAIGSEYRGHRVQKGDIIYLALEGQSGFANRGEAFRRKFLKDGDMVPAFRLCGANLDLIKDHQHLLKDIRDQSVIPACVVIDTLNRSLVGSEGKDEDMAAYLRAADAIQEAFSCLVIIIHHCGVNQDRPRGHTSQTGAADVQIAVKKDVAGNVVANVEFAKDMAEGETLVSRLELVELGDDQDGDEVTSCVVVPSDAVPVATQKLSDRQQLAIKALANVLTLNRNAKSVGEELWNDEMLRNGAIDPNGANPRARYTELRDALLTKGTIGFRDGQVWLN